MCWLISGHSGVALADILDQKGIPYIGPDATTMKALIHKTTTHRILKENSVSVPYHYQIDRGDMLPALKYPAFVKPSYESRSVGITDDSVVHSKEELDKRVAYIHSEYDQPALVEEYLPGQEYTVLMLGNGKHQEFLTPVYILFADLYSNGELSSSEEIFIPALPMLLSPVVNTQFPNL